jgi:hypothetical protein
MISIFNLFCQITHYFAWKFGLQRKFLTNLPKQDRPQRRRKGDGIDRLFSLGGFLFAVLGLAQIQISVLGVCRGETPGQVNGKFSRIGVMPNLCINLF